MSQKPIFVATHPRACSTAFERVFMTRRDILKCVHEPFGDAYYFGTERLAPRYEDDEEGRKSSGFSECTYRTIFENIERENTEGKRLFIKDMAQYLMPQENKPASIAPSLVSYKRGVGTNGSAHLQTTAAPSSSAEDIKTNGATNGHTKTSPPYPYPTASEPGNPTVVPEEMLKQFHFTFLIRHPRSSIPSYYRCCIPPLDEMTGFHEFDPKEAGYVELRTFFDYLRGKGLVGPSFAGPTHGGHGTSSTNGETNGIHSPNGDATSFSDKVQICLIDADDMLDNPAGVLSAYCKSVGIDFSEKMLNWDNDEDHRVAKEAFEKWKGFHEDAIESTELKARVHKKTKTDEQLYGEWVEKYGEKGAKVIKDTVAANVEHYEYLKQFALKV